MASDRLRDLHPDRQRRVQRGHRILEDHRDLAPAHVLELALRELRQVAPLEPHLPADDAGGRLRDEPDDGEGRHRLAAARLADDADGLALLEVEAHAVDRVHDALAGEEVRLEIADGEERVRHQVSRVLGSSASRRPSATKFAHRIERRDRDRGDDDEQREDAVRLVALLRHRAPGGVRRSDAEAEEREECFPEDDARQLQEHRDDEHPERVRQEVSQQNPMPARAHDSRSAHVVVLLQRDDLAADDAGRGEPGRDRERDDQRPEPAAAEDRERDDRERQVRETVEGVEEAHHAVVDLAADEPRDRSVGDADDEDHDRRGEPDPDRDAPAERGAGEQVAAEAVRAERVLEARALARLREVDLVRVVRRHGRPDEAEQDHEHEHHACDDRGAVSDVAIPRVPQQARLADRRAGRSRLGGRRCERELSAGRRLRDRRHQVLASRVRGSRIPYRMSTTRFATMTMIASSTVRPMTTE